MMPVLLLVVAHGRRGLAAADFPVLTPERWMSELENYHPRRGKTGHVQTQRGKLLSLTK
jgi:hypothetical protein